MKFGLKSFSLGKIVSKNSFRKFVFIEKNKYFVEFSEDLGEISNVGVGRGRKKYRKL